ncbi:MAG: hypothetical protein TYPL_1980 [Candidatus Tyloplasma litorale]|nr:MAG: hypothetical protein TYPL_1980 [Mycoplasmatales bacterium]
MINNLVYSIHKRLNDIKGVERKIILFNGKDLKIEISESREDIFLIEKHLSFQWIYKKVFNISNFDHLIKFSSFKPYGTTSAQKERTAIFKSLLQDSINENEYLYLAYYIGGKDNEIIASEIGKISKEDYQNQIKIMNKFESN